MHKHMSPHGDFDHMGEAINLVNNFELDKVIFFYMLHSIYCVVSSLNLRLYR